ncbi:hypothetical protein Ciccas_011301 [Cichlidogyrus casuarinus]|uniref:Uncharacterized protein n=1 Tax=Cichlidogyrus casuarinus TaxID=1844966 RepID=A0ABD2PUJ8_9PLAT
MSESDCRLMDMQDDSNWNIECCCRGCTEKYIDGFCGTRLTEEQWTAYYNEKIEEMKKRNQNKEAS